VSVDLAVVVLELEADLVEFRTALRQRDPGEHADLWKRESKRLWFKVFQMSQNWRDAPPIPSEVARELAGMSSPRQAAIRMIASALTTVSGEPDRLEAEADRLERSVGRFLDTPEGQARKAHIERDLTGGLE